MIISDQTIILENTLLAKSKLANMKSHLEALLRKKIRIETEIKLLKKQINSKNKSFELKIKNNLQLESSEPIPVNDAKVLKEDFPELYQAFLEFDQLTKEIQELTERFDENF